MWKAILAQTVPAALLAPYFVPPELLMYTYSALFLPTVYALYNRRTMKNRIHFEASEIYLYENGE